MMNITNETCLAQYTSYDNDTCPPVFDGWLCWPPTAPGSAIHLNCPVINVNGGSKNGTAFRVCSENSTWEGSTSTNGNRGYTNFSDCVEPAILPLLQVCQKIEGCNDVMKNTRILEMVGLSFSLVALLISLHIFFKYSILKNNRTKIHKNLFVATFFHILVRLIMYIDQELPMDQKFIAQTPYLDEACKSLLEYTKTAMFMWMFIEGLYLHNMITFAVFQEYPNIRMYFYMGWSVPAIMTLAWLITMIILKSNWSIYYFLPYYWILEGPRFVLIVVNLLFLINIMRVLVVKLRESHTTEIELIRKAVRAAIFLLPLLGISHILFYISYKQFTKTWHLALWCYVTYFLATFQGFFVAVLYCFLNGEVQTVLKKSLMVRMSMRSHDYTPCRNLTVLSSTNEPEATLNMINLIFRGGSPRWISRCFKQLNKSVTCEQQEEDNKDTQMIECEETIGHVSFETRV